MLGLFVDDFVAWKAGLKRFAEILKNHEKHCKVLQKSRFGRTAIDGKMSLGGKLRPMLTPSWLVRVQVGAKRGIGRCQESSKSHIRRPRRRTRAPEDDQESAKMAPRARSR